MEGGGLSPDKLSLLGQAALESSLNHTDQLRRRGRKEGQVLRKSRTSCGLSGSRQPNHRGEVSWQGAVWQRGMKEAD